MSKLTFDPFRSYAMRKALSALALCFVAIAPGAHAEPLTLTASYSSGAYKAVLEETARQFEARAPNVKIAFRSPVVTNYDELLQQTFRAQVTNDLPDVSFQGNQNIALLAARGLAVQLDPFIAAESNWDRLGYTPAVKSVGEVNGKVFGLSYATSVPIIYYNVDLVRRAGADPSNLPKTWPEIIALVKKVGALGSGLVGGYFDYTSTGNWTFQALITSQGGRMMSADDRTIMFDGPEGMKALQILRDFGAAGMVDMSQDQAIQAFAAGTIGVLVSFSAAMDRIERQAAGRFDVRTGAWPIPSKNGTVPAGGRTAVMFARDPARQRAVWEFIKFATGPVGQTILVKGVGAVPNNQIAIREPDLLGKFYEENQNQRAAFELVPILSRWYSFPGENGIKITDAIKNHLRSVLIQSQNPEDAMARMVRDVKVLLPKS